MAPKEEDKMEFHPTHSPQNPEVILKIKRKQYPSAAQKNQLLRLLEEDAELRRGKFSATFTFKESEARWLRIAEELNKMPGARKSNKEWRKTWQDMKSKVKKKDVEVRRSTSLTGGGPPLPPLSEEEEQVLFTMSEAIRVGHTDSQESLVVFNDHSYHVVGPDIEVIENQASTSSVPATQHEVSTAQPLTASDNVPTTPKQRSSTSARLQKSLNIADNLTKELVNKNKIKKEFYDSYLIELRKQTEAATIQAEALAQMARYFTARMDNIQDNIL